MEICKHIYKHMETRQENIMGGEGGYRKMGVTIIDRFYCEKCLDIVEKRKDKYE